MASPGNLITAAIGQLSGGPAADTTVDNSDSGYSSGSGVDDGRSTSTSESVDDMEDGLPGSEDSGIPTDSSDQSTAPAKAAQPDAKAAQKTPDKEVITVSDEKGNRRKVEIDYQDRAAIKKAFEMMHGARKWQAERDRHQSELKKIEPEYKQLRQVVDALEKAFEESGEEGVIDLIAGKPGHSKEYIKRQVDRAKFLEGASPEQIAQLQQKERLEKLERDNAKRERESIEREKRIAEKEEAAQKAEVQSRVNPVFDKYRFDGKLGDPDAEAAFDRTLWLDTMELLKPYEEQGLEITSELVDSKFREVSSRMRKYMSKQVEKQATRVVEQKKQEATENAQASAVQAYRSGGQRQEAESLIKQGNFRDLFKNFSKFR